MPRSPGWDNFAFIFQGMKLARPMVNSLLMCAAVIGSLVTSARWRPGRSSGVGWPRAGFLRIFFLAGLIVPFQIVMVPLLKEFRLIGIEFTYLALLLH